MIPATRRNTDLKLPLLRGFYIDLSPRCEAKFSLVQVISPNRVSSITCRGPPSQNHLGPSAQQQGDSWRRWRNTWKCTQYIPREVMTDVWRQVFRHLIIPKRDISHHITSYPLSKEERGNVWVEWVITAQHCILQRVDYLWWQRQKVKRVHTSNPTTICSSGDFTQSDLS